MTSRVHADPLESLDQLREEIAELRASRERIVLAADADRRVIERELHRGVQQHLVALAVNLQLAGLQVDTDPDAAKAAIGAMRRDVQQALAQSTELGQRIHPPLLEAGLAVALRTAVAGLGFPVMVDVETSAVVPPEVARTVFLCCREPLEHAGPDARAAVRVREADGELVVEVAVGGAEIGELGALHDRVEAFGGRLSLTSGEGATRLIASLPLSR